jgi:hypothetical protein
MCKKCFAFLSRLRIFQHSISSWKTLTLRNITHSKIRSWTLSTGLKTSGIFLTCKKVQTTGLYNAAVLKYRLAKEVLFMAKKKIIKRVIASIKKHPKRAAIIAGATAVAIGAGIAAAVMAKKKGKKSCTCRKK